jgi:outer membrane protein assembly factor BamB
VHITAVCPYCKTSYQLQPTLRGQSIRCPNAGCRKIFAIPADLRVTDTSTSQLPPTGGSAPDTTQRSGSVGDMVPILPAEPVAPAGGAPSRPGEGDWWETPPPVREPSGRPSAARPAVAPPASPPPPPTATPPATTPVDAPWWRETPPPVRSQQAQPEAPASPPAPRRRPPETEKLKPRKERTTRSTADTQPMKAIPLPVPEGPRELPPGAWEPPPVRRGAEAVAEVVEEAPPEEAHTPAVTKRHAWGIIFLLFFGVVGILGGGGVLIYFAVHKSEEARFAEALEEYRQGKYSSAASKLHELAQRFPESEHAPKYRFLEEWAALCSDLTNSDTDLNGNIGKLDSFLKDHKADPYWAEYGQDAGKMLANLSKTFAERNANPRDDSPLAVAKSIEQLRDAVKQLSDDALSKEQAGQIDTELAGVRTAVARWRERQEVLVQLTRKPGELPYDAIKRARLVLERKDQARPGFSQDAEMQAAMTRLYDEHMQSVAYKPRTEPPPPPKAERGEDKGRSLLFAPLLPTAAPGAASRNEPIVLALVRGVLYALKQSNGELKWAIRVGVDTTVLPHRVPASAVSRERLLVLSADAQTLTALDDDGQQLWEYHVGQAVLGRPVIIGQRAYLAAYDGWVHEIELAEGQLLGRYSLGQRLTSGGAREGDSKRIYFPADDSCIYVLDVGEQRCVHILYDGHPSGSLRSEPIVVPPDNPNASGYLILNQASGLDAMSLKVFELPLQDRHALPVELKPPARLEGWTWFEPYQDGEKLAVLSDAGMLGLFGIRQAGNSDQALFPLLPSGSLNLSPFLGVTRDGRRERGRSQVVQMQGDDLWVLAHGRLQQVQLRWNNATGPQAVPGWDSPRVLGSPLHAPQRVEDPRTNRSTFFLVTQPLERQTCLASALDDEGHTLWQRQLGLVCQGEPLVLTPPGGGPPMLVALDQGGGLFALTPPKPPAQPRTNWEIIAPALDDNPRLPPRLVLAPDGHSAYEFAAPGAGKTLLVRHIEWAGRSLRVNQREVPLTAAAGGTMLVPAGDLAVVGSQLIMPLEEGNLARLQLPVAEDARFQTSGPDWRDSQAPPAALGHVLALGGDRFLVTDGAHGLAVWEWAPGKEYQALPEGRDVLTYRLDHLIASPPVLVPAKDGMPPRVLVADATGVLHLLVVGMDGSLQPAEDRHWDLKGTITGAPFLRTLPDGKVRIGVILDQRQLVWLDPDNADPLWTYRSKGETIVGQPQMIEDMLVVALQSGHYLGLDPATGEPKGPGYTLRASAAPSAAPVPFDSGRMFMPLSDGTALLLSLQLLRQPAEK